MLNNKGGEGRGRHLPTLNVEAGHVEHGDERRGVAGGTDLPLQSSQSGHKLRAWGMHDSLPPENHTTLQSEASQHRMTYRFFLARGDGNGIPV